MGDCRRFDRDADQYDVHALLDRTAGALPLWIEAGTRRVFLVLFLPSGGGRRCRRADKAAVRNNGNEHFGIFVEGSALCSGAKHGLSGCLLANA